jgi:putative membrane protein
MIGEQIGNLLAPVNAVLNASSFVLLVAGYVQIKKKRRKAHETCMKLAFLTSAVFLASYLTRYALTGTHHIAAGGWVKAGYLILLFSHMVLAAATVPLVFRTLFLARAARFAEHRRIARVTFPIWVYVSLTGVLVYAILYHLVGTVPEGPRLTDPPPASSVRGDR